MMIRILLLIIFLLPVQVYAAFQYLEVGARPAGMSGAYSAIADDANSIIYNVAGLGELTQPELSTIYAALNPGVDDNLGLGGIAYVHPFSKIGTFGFGYMEFGSNLYKERVVTLSYGRKMPYLTKLCVGLTLKNMSHGYVTNAYTRMDPTFANRTDSSNIGLDVGLIYSDIFLPGISVVAVGKNINQPDVGVKKRDVVPAEYRVGMGYKKDNLSLDIEGLCNTSSNSIRRFLVGGEIWFLNHTTALRGGVGIGNNEYYNISTGFSWSFSIVKIIRSVLDYSFSYNPTGLAGAGKHQISLSFKF